MNERKLKEEKLQKRYLFTGAACFTSVTRSGALYVLKSTLRDMIVCK